jgi:hypothetical protein
MMEDKDIAIAIFKQQRNQAMDVAAELGVHLERLSRELAGLKAQMAAAPPSKKA